MPHYLILDCETNGLFRYFDQQGNPIPADAPGQPRVAQVGMIFVSPTYEIEAEHEFNIRPEGWSMTPGATAVNGITDEFLREKGVPIKNALDLYAAGLDARRVIVGHNVNFDLKCMRAELRREGMDDRHLLTRSICTMILSRAICNLGKMPKLEEACSFFGIKQHAGHTAIADAHSAFSIMGHLRARGVLTEPKNSYDKGKKPKPAPRARGKPVVVTGNEEIGGVPETNDQPETPL